MKTYRIICFLAIGILFALLLPTIVDHAIWLMGGAGLSQIMSARWDVAVINIAFFLVFLGLINYKKMVDWRSKNIYLAFIIALFAEMYGFPLTAYFVANYFGAIEVGYEPEYLVSFSILGTGFAMSAIMLVGAIVTIAGLVLIVAGWHKVYKSEGQMITTGLYGLSRHPQYVGIMLVATGWIIHWPTLLTLLMWPALAVSYYRLSRSEENWMLKKFPKEFKKYMCETPMFV